MTFDLASTYAAEEKVPLIIQAFSVREMQYI
jgi:hypothetical protein